MFRQLWAIDRSNPRYCSGNGESIKALTSRLVFSLVIVGLIGVINLACGGARLLAEETNPTASQTESPEKGDERFGRVIPVRLPINGPTSARVKQTIQKILTEFKGSEGQLVLILRFDTNRGEEQFAARSEFGACYDLADFLTSEALSKVHTVAYVPCRAEGHAVLPIMACREIILAPDAEWGAAGAAERRITPPMVSAYRHIAER
ncbi:MAG TPA: hypothetical protein PLO20_11380, partial [Thermogutta sp.]|nr:hypothetical protein [Thermogutta sp.]